MKISWKAFTLLNSYEISEIFSCLSCFRWEHRLWVKFEKMLIKIISFLLLENVFHLMIELIKFVKYSFIHSVRLAVVPSNPSLHSTVEHRVMSKLFFLFPGPSIHLHVRPGSAVPAKIVGRKYEQLLVEMKICQLFRNWRDTSSFSSQKYFHRIIINRSLLGWILIRFISFHLYLCRCVPGSAGKRMRKGFSFIQPDVSGKGCSSQSASVGMAFAQYMLTTDVHTWYRCWCHI